MVSVNVLGLLYTTHAALPHLVQAAEDSPRRVADLVNVGSVAGRQARAGIGRVQPHEVRRPRRSARDSARRSPAVTSAVSVVEPGRVDTELQTHIRAGGPGGVDAALRGRRTAEGSRHRRGHRVHRDPPTTRRRQRAPGPADRTSGLTTAVDATAATRSAQGRHARRPRARGCPRRAGRGGARLQHRQRCAARHQQRAPRVVHIGAVGRHRLRHHLRWPARVGWTTRRPLRRRRLFVGGLVACLRSRRRRGDWPRTSRCLVAARVVQGIAAAAVAPAALSILTTSFHGPSRTRVLGYYGATASVGFVLGLVLGGVLVQTGGWRAVSSSMCPSAWSAQSSGAASFPSGPTADDAAAPRLDRCVSRHRRDGRCWSMRPLRVSTVGGPPRPSSAPSRSAGRCSPCSSGTSSAARGRSCRFPSSGPERLRQVTGSRCCWGLGTPAKCCFSASMRNRSSAIRPS